ncbi:unnamed protein product [Bursaphelenchus okinawaensis]|uniref:Uncharacterized protein n=1 Tax=Bursaphelenchus okinawaensis TaxID=465554 RepID=A0A811LCT6_9BILA|nr:unnamed protein product [Bursaphelenchus okinawaensis]CAG9121552.1 unnamed protein product [Bursaphelenchus okinawaensis]
MTEWEGMLIQLVQSSDQELQNLRQNANDSEIIKGLEDRLQKATKEADLERQKLSELRLAKEKTEEKLQTLQNSLRQSENDKNELLAKLQKLEKEMTLKKEAEQAKEKMIKEKEEQIEQMKEKEAHNIEKITKYEETKEEYNAISNALNQIASTLQVAPELSKILSELAQRSTRLSTLERQLAEGVQNEKSIVEMKQDIDKLRKEKEANMKKLDEATSSCNELSTRIEKMSTEKKDEVVFLNNEVNRLKSRELDLEQDLDRFKRSEQSLSERLKAAELDLSRKNNVDTVAIDKINMLESDLEEMGKQNSVLREKALTEQKRFDDEMRNMRDEMIENIRRLSDLLEAESKRLQTANSERETLAKEAQNLKNALNEQKKLLEQKADSESKTPKTDSGLKARCEELMRENAELAADLLKKERNGTDGTLREMEHKYMSEAQSWRKERMALENQIEELKNELNSLNNPKPKPRKINGYSTLPSHPSIPASETSSADESTVTLGSNGTSDNVHAEVERQKRLINVLRRKLQHQQIERFQQSRSFCATIK